MLSEALFILFFMGTSPKCDGKGICQMQIEQERIPITMPNCVEARIAPYGAGVMVAITEADIKDETFLKHFTGNHFEMPEDYAIPQEIIDKIVLKNTD